MSSERLLYTSYEYTKEQVDTMNALVKRGFREYKIMGASMTMSNQSRDLAFIQADGSYTIRNEGKS